MTEQKPQGERKRKTLNVKKGGSVVVKGGKDAGKS